MFLILLSDNLHQKARTRCDFNLCEMLLLLGVCSAHFSTMFSQVISNYDLIQSVYAANQVCSMTEDYNNNYTFQNQNEPRAIQTCWHSMKYEKIFLSRLYSYFVWRPYVYTAMCCVNTLRFSFLTDFSTMTTAHKRFLEMISHAL